MSEFADQVIEFVTLCKEYGESTDQPDRASFARWLLEREKKEEEVRRYGDDIRSFIPEKEADDLQNAELSMFWGQVDNYRALLFKHVLKALDLNGIDEYTLLLYVEVYEAPSKKAYVKASQLEPTTCFEMIKRLQRKGFILEEQNPDDRRSSLMRITPSGSQVLSKAKTKLIQVNRHMFAHLSTDQKVLLLRELKKMVTTVTQTLEVATSKGFDTV